MYTHEDLDECRHCTVNNYERQEEYSVTVQHQCSLNSIEQNRKMSKITYFANLLTVLEILHLSNSESLQMHVAKRGKSHELCMLGAMS